MNDDLVAIEDQIAVVRRRWRTVATCVVLVTAAAIGLALLQNPLYSATAQVLVAPVGSGDQVADTLEPEEIATQVEVIRSAPVAAGVVRALDLRRPASDLLDHVAVEQLGDTRVLTITVSDSAPRQARRLANAFAREYLTYRRRIATQAVSSSRNAVETQIADIRRQLSQVERSLPRVGPVERRDLRAQRNALMIQLAQAQTSLLALASEPTAVSGGEVLVPATLPSDPSEPQLPRSGLFGVALGLLLGVGAAFLRDRLDDAVRDDTRPKQILHRPVLGRVPAFNRARAGVLPTLTEPHGPVSEAFRSLVSNVRFVVAASGNSAPLESTVLLVTSPRTREGKSTVAANLAVAAARFGLEVVLVDGDVREPSLGELFGVGTPPGLSEALAREHELDDLLIGGMQDGLSLLTSGDPTPNGAELLASPAAQDLLRRLRSRAELIVVDGPPALGVADTLELARAADLVVLVVRHGTSRARSVQRAAEQLHQIGAQVAGMVYNAVPHGELDDASTYGYGRTARAAENSPQSSTPSSTRSTSPSSS